mmetsp:Transcript_36725/g.118478  ORF Transcript_36725/g.118478 Transcript_36725/m.118478 type:complete len:251 (+) Transcript_36725:555-1307(+)
MWDILGYSGIYGALCFFGRIRLRQKEGVTRITESKRNRLASSDRVRRPSFSFVESVSHRRTTAAPGSSLVLSHRKGRMRGHLSRACDSESINARAGGETSRRTRGIGTRGGRRARTLRERCRPRRGGPRRAASASSRARGSWSPSRRRGQTGSPARCTAKSRRRGGHPPPRQARAESSAPRGGTGAARRRTGCMRPTARGGPSRRWGWGRARLRRRASRRTRARARSSSRPARSGGPPPRTGRARRARPR